MLEKGSATPTPLSRIPVRKAILPVPTTRQLYEFAAIGAAILIALAAWQAMHNRAFASAAMYSAAALLLGIIGFRRPRWLAHIFATWLFLTSPLSWLVSAVLLALVFYGIFTPLSFLFKLLGRESLDRRIRTDQDTYWRVKPAAKDIRRYFQQF
jgi:hypothetical protein